MTYFSIFKHHFRFSGCFLWCSELLFVLGAYLWRLLKLVIVNPRRTSTIRLNVNILFLLSKIMRDSKTGNSIGFGFVSYESFELSDQVIKVMESSHWFPVFQFAMVMVVWHLFHATFSAIFLGHEQPTFLQPSNHCFLCL